MESLRHAGLARWRSKPATDMAMTGVPARHRAADLRQSREFLKLVASKPHTAGSMGSTSASSGAASRKARRPVWPRAVLDCGAGIGRGASGLLLRLPGVERVDLLEPAAQLRKRAREALATHPKVRRFFATPLEGFTPQYSYDLLWVNWVLMYIPDAEVVSFLQRCRLRLPAGGVIAVKENVENRRSEEQLDAEDFCVARTAGHFEQLFAQAGLRVLLKRKQKDWPTSEGYFPLTMWALVPGTAA